MVEADIGIEVLNLKKKAMSNNHLSYFKIENFKKFSSLELDDLGKFNLIVGENNVGKTTVLESLCFDVSLPDLLSNYVTILNWRNLDNIERIEFDYFSLFKNNKTIDKINYYFRNIDNIKLNSFSLRSTTIAELEQKELDQLRKKSIKSSTSNKFVALLDYDNKVFVNYLNSFAEFRIHDSYIPCIPFRANTYDDLMEYYSTSFQNSKSIRKELIESLKLFIPDAEDIEISTGIIPSQNCLIIWRQGFDTPFLVNLFGEGTNKILRALLEIKKCSNNKLMIDEVDCGIHYSKMKNFFKVLISAAQKDNVQIFATTHSKECIENFTKALEETGMQDEGRIIRLAETKNGIKAFTMRFAEFENSLMAESEIR